MRAYAGLGVKWPLKSDIYRATFIAFFSVRFVPANGAWTGGEGGRGCNGAAVPPNGSIHTRFGLGLL